MDEIRAEQEAILEEFSQMGDSFSCYSYLLALAALLPPCPEEARTPDNAVQGCQSHVWLRSWAEEGRFRFLADSGALLVTKSGDLSFRIGHPLHALPVGTVQQLLDKAANLNLDYVHGEDAVRAIVQKENAVGILLPPMPKSLLFPAVAKDGPLPRKTFSLGEANEKRYYMEARKIVKE